MNDCGNCRHTNHLDLPDFSTMPCAACARYGADNDPTMWEAKPMTNYDQIVNKTPEELAEWLADILNHCENKKPEELCRMSCPLYKCCTDQPSDNIEDWLKATVEVET